MFLSLSLERPFCTSSSESTKQNWESSHDTALVRLAGRVAGANKV